MGWQGRLSSEVEVPRQAILPLPPSPRQVASLYSDCQQSENQNSFSSQSASFADGLCKAVWRWLGFGPQLLFPTPAGGCSVTRCPTAAPPASLQHPPLPQPASLQLLNSLPGGLPLIYAASALSWIIILYKMFVLYPPPVLKCQEYIPRPSVFNTSAWAWQFSDMNIMALNTESPSLKLTSVRISSLEQDK